MPYWEFRVLSVSVRLGLDWRVPLRGSLLPGTDGFSIVACPFIPDMSLARSVRVYFFCSFDLAFVPLIRLTPRLSACMRSSYRMLSFPFHIHMLLSPPPTLLCPFCSFMLPDPIVPFDSMFSFDFLIGLELSLFGTRIYRPQVVVEYLSYCRELLISTL